MNYSAKSVYRSETVASVYERQRFQNWRGRMAGALEERRMLTGVRRLGVPNDALLLDVPAGTGRLSISAIRQGYRVIGLDVSSAMLRQGFALHALGSHRAFLGAAAGDVERLPLADQSVDAVMCLRLMGHLPPATKECAIREMLRVARVGAVVMFARRTALLRFKRDALWLIGARPRAAHWFDESDHEIRTLVKRSGGETVCHEDLCGPFAESRAYVIRPGR